jgi:hypothetical protein
MQNIAPDATLSDITFNDYIMARDMAETLHKHYPGHLWAVTCEGRTGIATIRDLYLSGQWGYVLKLPAIYSAAAMARDVMRAGGEVLERFRMARGRFNENQYQELPTNFAGRLEAAT